MTHCDKQSACSRGKFAHIADSSYVMSYWTSRRSWYLFAPSVFVSTARLRPAGSCPVMPVLPVHGGSPSRGRTRCDVSVARPVGLAGGSAGLAGRFPKRGAPQFEGSRATLRMDGRMDSCSCSESTRPAPPATAHACAAAAEYSDRGVPAAAEAPSGTVSRVTGVQPAHSADSAGQTPCSPPCSSASFWASGPMTPRRPALPMARRAGPVVPALLPWRHGSSRSGLVPATGR
jgi:hypothetical protein